MDDSSVSEDKRKITVVVEGKFMSFDYAAELYRQGRLQRLISTMPYMVARRYGIGKEVFVGMPYFEVLKRVWRRLFRKEPPTLWYTRTFTRTALRHVPSDTEVIITFAGFSLEILESPRLHKAVKILDRAATHTLANTKLRLQAAAYHGVTWKPHPTAFIERELREYALADRILVGSGFVRQTFLDNGIPEHKIWRIPYGMSKFKFAGLTLNGEQSSSERIVLFVGQISARKGVGVLVKAMEIVRQQRPDAVLWLVGARLPGFPDAILNHPWIKVCGILRGQELYDAFSRAAVFSILSFEEGMALVLTEALQFGMPIVLTPNTGGRDLVREPEDGYFVPVGDAEAAAEKILLTLDRGQRPKEPFRHTWADFTNELLHKLKPLPTKARRLEESIPV